MLYLTDSELGQFYQCGEGCETEMAFLRGLTRAAADHAAEEIVKWLEYYGANDELIDEFRSIWLKEQKR